MTSGGDSSFLTNYVLFDHDGLQSLGDMPNKALTFMGASAVSLLCYSSAHDAAELLRIDPKFDLIRRHDIVSAVWAPAETPRIAADRAPPFLAWSKRLQTVFVGFRGTTTWEDVGVDLDIRQATDPSLASRFHSGFDNRAIEYFPAVQELSKHYKVVVCEHRLG